MSNDCHELGGLIKLVEISLHREVEAGLEAHGLSLAQWKALREIDNKPRAPQLALASCALVSAQAFGTLLTRLIARGLVKRSAGEGRATVHALTAKGKAALSKGREVRTEVFDAAFGRLKKAERIELKRLLIKLNAPSPPGERVGERAGRQSLTHR